MPRRDERGLHVSHPGLGADGFAQGHDSYFPVILTGTEKKEKIRPAKAATKLQ